MKLSFSRVFGNWLKNKQEFHTLAWTLSILWICLISWLAFFWNLGNIGLIDETEPLFAEAARQMKVTGDWITPYFNGETRFDKPALIYWLMAIAYHIIGVNEWAVRLPSALSAMGLISLGFYTLWRFGIQSSVINKQTPEYQYWLTASLGAALMALNPLMIIWARTGVSDMLLTGCIGGALLSFFLGYAQPSKPVAQKRWYVAFYVLIALAILTKGPIGIVLPGLIIGSFLFYLGNVREVLREMRPLLGSLVIIAIALPWYILVTVRNGSAFVSSFFGYHNLERFTGVVNHHSAPIYFYFVVVLFGFAPWSIYLPSAIASVKFWQRSYWRSSYRSTQLGLFAFFWFTGIFGFFTIAITKLPSYILPLIPAAAILVALFWTNQTVGAQTIRRREQNTLLVWSSWLNIVFVSAIATALFFLPSLVGADPAIPNLRQLLQQSNLPVIASVIWAITAVIGAILLLRRQWSWLLSVNLVGFMAFLIFVVTPAAFLMDQARQFPLRELSAIASAVQQPDEDLIMVGFKKPSVVFYTQRKVTYILQPEKAVDYVTKLAATKAPPFSVLILTQPKKLKAFKLQYQDLGKTGAYQLVRIFVPK